MGCPVMGVSVMVSSGNASGDSVMVGHTMLIAVLALPVSCTRSIAATHIWPFVVTLNTRHPTDTH